MLYTGQETMTGGRILKAKDYINNETFMLTYGDGVANIDIPALINLHKKSGKQATMTAVQPTGRFGAIEIESDSTVNSFIEKPKGDGTWINGGFFVLEPEIFDYINNGEQTVWEREPLENIAKNNQLNAYKHNGFWQPMDTLRDKIELTNMWQSCNAPWQIWD
jgi:glucose-1-phosphate cytidylyltransferase